MDAPLGNPGETTSSEPDVAASGSRVFVAWTEDSVAPSTSKDVYLRRSTDGGKTYESPLWMDEDALVDDSEPRVAASGDLVVVAWLHGSPQDVLVRVSHDGGQTFGAVTSVGGSLAGDLGDADHLRLEVDDPYVHLVFEDDAVVPGGNEDVYAISSVDAGASFGAPVLLGDAGAGLADVDDPEVGVVGANAWVVWIDDRLGQDHVYLALSTDGGLSFGANRQLDSAPLGADTGSPQIAVKGDKVYVVWLDDRNPVVVDQVFLTFSEDAGATFTKDVPVGAIPVGSDMDDPSIALGGPRLVYVAWADDRNGLENDVFVATSDDGGKSFHTEVALDADLGTVADSNPRLAASGEQVYCLYQEESVPGGDDRVFLAHNPRSGSATAWSTRMLSTGLSAGQDTDAHEIALTSYRDVTAVWLDDRAGPGNSTNDVHTSGLRLPSLEVVTTGNKRSFQLSDASPGEVGMLYLCAFSATGTAWNELPDGSGNHVCLTPDGITLLLLNPWALTLFTANIDSSGGASTIPVKLPFSGHAVGIVIDTVNGLYPAATDPVDF